MKAIFLDKDGTLIENIPYNVNPDLIQFCEGALEGLKILNQAGYQLFIITNQSGIARGYFLEDALKPVEGHLRKRLSEININLAGFYYCPHHPEGTISEFSIDCDCRKPQPGLLKKAAIEHHLNLSQSWLIGDILHDIEAGNLAGCRTILINNGNETEWQLSQTRLPHHLVNNLTEAARIITAFDQGKAEDYPTLNLTNFSPLSQLNRDRVTSFLI